MRSYKKHNKSAKDSWSMSCLEGRNYPTMAHGVVKCHEFQSNKGASNGIPSMIFFFRQTHVQICQTLSCSGDILLSPPACVFSNLNSWQCHWIFRTPDRPTEVLRSLMREALGLELSAQGPQGAGNCLDGSLYRGNAQESPIFHGKKSGKIMNKCSSHQSIGLDLHQIRV